MKTLGDRIRELRGEKDVSLRELAKKLGLSAAFLSDVELGRRYPSGKVLTRIARELGEKEEELRSHDTRAPLEGLKRLTQLNPAYGIALRKVVNGKVSAEDLMRLASEKPKRKKKKQ